jgi:hypothetical protein
MVLWVVALSARDTIMRWILSHSLTMNSFWAFRTGLMIASPYWLGCLKPTREADFIVQILVAGRELVSEQMQQGEIDLIDTVRIGRMNLDVRRVVEQDVEHVLAFVLVCSDDVGIDRDVVGDQSIGNDSFLKTEVFR